ncbi:helix-turn-helix transcriptional regulator [Enterococcus sp.]|uniref:helix-turn-helix domain-containing protein n=1 Tax=Enterococcus sp. TaxID=35783 RepID=UPI000EEC965E|nr:helix-turn-helix transcriptional regulator [Enterococcus sp.]HCM84864.1 hypothetical protein [Enterococcus sp.]
MFFYDTEKLYDLKEVGKRIRQIRGDYTLEELGFLADRTSKAAVYNWENGKSLPNKERLKVIAVLGRTTVQWILFGDFSDYVQTLFTVDSSPYSDIKRTHAVMDKKELFDLYESAPEELRQSIIEKVVEESNQKKWSYSDAYQITKYFLEIADNVLVKERNRKITPAISRFISEIEKQNLTDKEVDSLFETVRLQIKSLRKHSQ